MCLEIGHIAAKFQARWKEAGAILSVAKRGTKSPNVPTGAYAFYAPKEDQSRGTTKQEASGVLTPQKTVAKPREWK